ncbi:uncharacterized protein LTR77_003563 [Saxophila tyrrhenica]|uniref:Uncharacterized protein n=1 Tax=Saxophila tyrrhenica TaxID=1690608 RepID=A0AAV9PGV8_9PEZI|nr:hypothetical protein LTR77_003563 [Saxophila tyrrhenica]
MPSGHISYRRSRPSNHLRAIKTQRPDMLCDILHWAVDVYRFSSFETFDIHVSIHPGAAAIQVVDTSGQFIGWDKYVFQVWGQADKTMAVRLDSRGCIRVWFNDRWARFTRFLRLIKPPYSWNLSKGPLTRADQDFQWYQQSRWWLGNRKSFLFLRLPPEIRNLIYGFALGDKIEPYPTHRDRGVGSNSRSMIIRRANTALLQVSPLVYKEVSDMIYTFTPFFVEHFGVAEKLLRKPRPCSRIRQLELALTHDDFFWLFGGQFEDDGVMTAPHQAATTLRNMRLSKLRLRIAEPRPVTADERFDGACQKTVVDWILEAAWPTVRGHPVELAGYVKARQKRAFEAACKAERKKFDVWQKQRMAVGDEEGSWDDYDEWLEQVGDDEGGGVMLAETTMVIQEDELFAAGRVKISAERPLCLCKVHCAVECWSADD